MSVDILSCDDLNDWSTGGPAESLLAVTDRGKEALGAELVRLLVGSPAHRHTRERIALSGAVVEQVPPATWHAALDARFNPNPTE